MHGSATVIAGSEAPAVDSGAGGGMPPFIGCSHGATTAGCAHAPVSARGGDEQASPCDKRNHGEGQSRPRFVNTAVPSPAPVSS